MRKTITETWIKFSTAFREVAGTLSHTEAHVFMAIALHVGSNGTSWPSIETIAEESNCNERTVRRAINNLASKGLLTVHRRRGAKNIYRPFYVAFGMENQPHPPAQKSKDTGDTPDTGVLTTPDTDVLPFGQSEDSIVSYEEERTKRRRTSSYPASQIEKVIQVLDKEFHTHMPRTKQTREIASFILSEAEKGNGLKTFIEWARRDKFNAGRLYEYGEHPDRIKTRWKHAFMSKEREESEPIPESVLEARRRLEKSPEYQHLK